MTLHADAVVAPALRAVAQSVEVVSFCLVSIENSDLSKPVEFDGSRFQLSFSSSENRSVEERRASYESWLLSKAFQELARGIRQMLEEAFFYNSMVNFANSDLSEPITWGKFQDLTNQFRAIANKARFPELMKKVNEGLIEPLHFEKEFLSLQKTRNCLEHRNGVVAASDVDKKTQTLRLYLPQLKLFREEYGEEVEIGKGTFLEQGTVVGIKHIIKEREFKVSERIVFKAEEFHDIGYGCWAFTNDLKRKLPKIEKKKVG